MAGAQIARSSRLGVARCAIVPTANSATMTQTAMVKARPEKGAQISSGPPGPAPTSAPRSTHRPTSGHTTAATALTIRRCVGSTPACALP